MALVIFKVKSASAHDPDYVSGGVYAVYSEKVDDEESAKKQLFSNDGMGDIEVDMNSIKVIPMRMSHESGILIGKPVGGVLTSLQNVVNSLQGLFPMTVHILQYGSPLCGFSGEVPSRWPPEHKWVALKDKEQATCLGCRKRAEEMRA